MFEDFDSGVVLATEGQKGRESDTHNAGESRTIKRPLEIQIIHPFQVTVIQWWVVGIAGRKDAAELEDAESSEVSGPTLTALMEPGISKAARSSHCRMAMPLQVPKGEM